MEVCVGLTKCCFGAVVGQKAMGQADEREGSEGRGKAGMNNCDNPGYEGRLTLRQRNQVTFLKNWEKT